MSVVRPHNRLKALEAIGLAALLVATPEALSAVSNLKVEPIRTNQLSSLKSPPPSAFYIAPANYPKTNLQTSPKIQQLAVKPSAWEKIRDLDSYIDKNLGPFSFLAKVVGAIGGLTIIGFGVNAVAHQVHPDEVRLRETPLGTELGVPGLVLSHIHSEKTSIGEMLVPRRREGSLIRPFLAELASPRFASFRLAQLVARINNRFPLLAFSNGESVPVLDRASSWMSEAARRAVLLEEASRFYPMLSKRAELLDGKMLPPISYTENILARVGLVFEGRSLRGGKEITERVNHLESPTYYKLLFMLADLPLVFATALNHERSSQRELVLQDLDEVIEFALQSLRENKTQILQCLTGFDVTKKRIVDTADILEPMLLLPRTQSILYIALVSLGLMIYQSPADIEGKSPADLIKVARQEISESKGERWSRAWMLERTLETINQLTAISNIDLDALPPLRSNPNLIDSFRDTYPCYSRDMSPFSFNAVRRREGVGVAIRGLISTLKERWNSTDDCAHVANAFLKSWQASPTFTERILRAFNLDPRFRGDAVRVSGKVDVLGSIDWVSNARESAKEIGDQYSTLRGQLELPL